MRDITSLETGDSFPRIIGGIVDAISGSSNRRARSAADKLIQGVQQGGEAELAGINAATLASLGGAVGGGLAERQGLLGALNFLGGPGFAGGSMTPGAFGLPSDVLGQEFMQAAGTPFNVFGEANQALLPESLEGLFGGALTASSGMGGSGGIAGPGIPGSAIPASALQMSMDNLVTPSAGIAGPGSAPGMSGGLLGAVRTPFNPFVQAGQQAAGSLTGGLEAFINDPGMRFRLEEGQKALERSAAARGGLVGGRTLKDVARFSQGLASEEFGNAFNRALATAGLGLGAAGTQAGLTRAVGGDITQGLLGLGATTGGISRDIGDILGGSALGAAQSIAQRERLLGQIKANKKAGQQTLGERISQGLDPLFGVALASGTAFGPQGFGLFGRG